MAVSPTYSGSTTLPTGLFTTGSVDSYNVIPINPGSPSLTYTLPTPALPQTTGEIITFINQDGVNYYFLSGFMYPNSIWVPPMMGVNVIYDGSSWYPINA